MPVIKPSLLVMALIPITEDNFGGRRRFTHALPGDQGEILDVSDSGRLNILWLRTGTVTACSEGQEVARGRRIARA